MLISVHSLFMPKVAILHNIFVLIYRKAVYFFLGDLYKIINKLLSNRMECYLKYLCLLQQIMLQKCVLYVNI